MLKVMEIQYWLKIILQHADHYLRRYNELNERRENSIRKNKLKKNFSQEILEKEESTNN